MSWWGVIDTITLNFYLVTATTIVVFSTLWQISLFMARLPHLCRRSLHQRQQALSIIMESIWLKRERNLTWTKPINLTESTCIKPTKLCYKLDQDSGTTSTGYSSCQWLSSIQLRPFQFFKEKLPQYSTGFWQSYFLALLEWPNGCRGKGRKQLHITFHFTQF